MNVLGVIRVIFLKEVASIKRTRSEVSYVKYLHSVDTSIHFNHFC